MILGYDEIEKVEADKREPVEPPPASIWLGMSEQEKKAWAEAHLTPDEWRKAKEHFNRALMQLIMRFPFFGFMASQMAQNQVWVTKFEPMPNGDYFRTMSTDGKYLYIWPQFALYHNDKQLMAVLLHELFHNVLGHPGRGMGYDPVLRNMAMDYAVNLLVNDAALEAANLDRSAVKVKPEMYDTLDWYIPVHPHPVHKKPYYCVDERFRDDKGEPMQWEDIYRILEEKKCNCPQKESGGQDAGAGAENQINSKGKGKSKKSCPVHGEHGGNLLDDHDPWKPGNRPADAEGNQNNEKYDSEAPKKWAVDAHAKCSDQKMQGSIPSGVRRMIEEWLYPPLPWFRLLQSYMKMTPSEFSWNPGDIRFPDPMPWISEVPDLTYATFGFDTSGSMSQTEIAASVENARAIMRGFPCMKGRAYFWDAYVHDKLDLEDFDGTVKNGVGGGGGTSVSPQFQEIKTDGIEDKVSVHVCFTDGYVDWESVRPDDLKYDVLWVITNETQQPPNHPRYRFTRLNIK